MLDLTDGRAAVQHVSRNLIYSPRVMLSIQQHLRHSVLPLYVKSIKTSELLHGVNVFYGNRSGPEENESGMNCSDIIT